MALVGGFYLNKFCLKNKGSLHLLSASGWRVVCFREALKSMLPQQDQDGVLDSCPRSLTAELQDLSSLLEASQTAFTSA